MGELNGLYPDNAVPILDWNVAGTNATGYNVTNLTAAENFITRLSPSSCPLFGEVQDYVIKSDNFTIARTSFYTKYNEDMAHLVNWNKVSATDFDNTCEYLFFS